MDYPLKGLTYSEQVERYRQMDDDTMHAQVLFYERQIDGFLRSGEITQEEAWDGYFELLTECDACNFLEDRERILAKIDTKRYKPAESKDPRIIELVRFRAKMIGLI